MDGWGRRQHSQPRRVSGMRKRRQRGPFCSLLHAPWPPHASALPHHTREHRTQLAVSL